MEGLIVEPGDEPLAGARVSMAVLQSGEWNVDEDRQQTTGEDGRFSIAVSSLDVYLFVARDAFASRVVHARDARVIKLVPGKSEDVVPQKPAHEINAPKSGSLSRR